MQKMTDLEKPDDFVIATGVNHSVRDFCEKTFSLPGLNYLDHVVFDPLFFKPSEIIPLCGDIRKALKTLNWKPSYFFESIKEEMLESQLER